MSDEAIQFLIPSLMLFATGLLGVLLKKNLIIIFMCVELMLCGAMLAMLSFAHSGNDMNGAVFAFFVLAIAAVEVALGLAIIVRLFKIEGTVQSDKLGTLGD